MSIHSFEMKLGVDGIGTIELDGENIADLVSAVRMESDAATRGNKVTLEISKVAVYHDLPQATVTIGAKTRATLRRLKWAPPDNLVDLLEAAGSVQREIDAAAEQYELADTPLLDAVETLVSLIATSMPRVINCPATYQEAGWRGFLKCEKLPNHGPHHRSGERTWDET